MISSTYVDMFSDVGVAVEEVEPAASATSSRKSKNAQWLIPFGLFLPKKTQFIHSFIIILTLNSKWEKEVKKTVSGSFLCFYNRIANF